MRKSENFERNHVDYEKWKLSRENNIVSPTENSISLIQFLSAAVRIINNDKNLELRDTKFLNGGNVIHMAVELCHLDYIKYFSVNKIDINQPNDFGYSPLSIAVYKNHKPIKIRILKILKLENLYPYCGKLMKDAVLKLLLSQQDLDSAFELIK